LRTYSKGETAFNHLQNIITIILLYRGRGSEFKEEDREGLINNALKILFGNKDGKNRKFNTISR
jgi:hypothetical protein